MYSWDMKGQHFLVGNACNQSRFKGTGLFIIGDLDMNQVGNSEIFGGEGLGVVMPIQVKTAEAARLLRMSVRRAGALARSGMLPSYKIGAARYFSVGCLIQWAREQSSRYRSGERRRSSLRVCCAIRMAG